MTDAMVNEYQGAGKPHPLEAVADLSPPAAVVYLMHLAYAVQGQWIEFTDVLSAEMEEPPPAFVSGITARVGELADGLAEAVEVYMAAMSGAAGPPSDGPQATG